ncbi:hypothetical protein DUNSADRAFT_7293 [Dunaliella salina]|uniref:Uncharacterized protein n=1 Tax=Dunaliella salina TaxID=3046 RepID=A0ABQ7GLL4_DUNSA|nr:hypothetical protein DUNSADRAFT_7293 [Dunaliella salina]|eukprot:KAF5835509.1 hypothetical protein DUNSADRAFT_7293 [Dunaliella salina]
MAAAEAAQVVSHLQGLYAIKCPSGLVISHAASMLRSFVQGSPLPRLDPAADGAARMLAQAKAQEAETGQAAAAAAAAVVAVKPEPGSEAAQAPAAARKGRRERKASVKKEETLEDVPPTPAAKGRGRGRRAVKKQEYEEDDNREEEYKPPPAKKSGGRKRKAVESTPEPLTLGGLPDADMDIFGDLLEPQLPKAPKKSRSKYAAITGEQALDDEGWMAYAPSIIYKCPPPEDPSHKFSKIAAFDVGPDDWRLYNENVPSILQSLHNQGYRIVILK